MTGTSRFCGIDVPGLCELASTLEQKTTTLRRQGNEIGFVLRRQD